MPTLTHINGPRKGEIVQIASSRFSIGRDPSSDLVLEDLSVSAHHAEVRREKNIWSLRDLGSSNGTTHNGSRTYLAIIKDGDQLGFGDLTFRFQHGDAGSADKSTTRMVHLPDAADSALIETEDDEVDALEWTLARREELLTAMRPYQIGSSESVDQHFACLLCRGHALLSGPCGLSRLRFAEAFGRLVGLELVETQSSIDLGKSAGDIGGRLIITRNINDLPADTQSRLFSLMRHGAAEPFLVLGVRESLDPMRLSPAQLNLFLMDVRLSYPTREQEENLLAGLMESEPLEPVIQRAQLTQLQDVMEELPAPQRLREATLDLVRATRPRELDAPLFVQEHVLTGAGPSAGRMLLLAAKTWAFIHGRFEPEIGDLRAMMPLVLSHRIRLRDGEPADDLLERLADHLDLA